MKSMIVFVAVCVGATMTAADNLLPNPSFEEGSDRPSGWAVWAKEPTAALWSTANIRSGSRSMQVGAATHKDGARWLQEEAIRIVPGRKYRLTGWVKTEDALGNVNIAIGWYSAKGWLATSRSVELNRTHDWRQLSVEAVAPPEAVCAKINFGKRLPGRGSAWFDDLEFVLIGESIPEAGSLEWDRKLERKISAVFGEKGAGTPLKLAVLNPAGAMEAAAEKEPYRIKDAMGNFSGFLSEPVPLTPGQSLELAVPCRRNGSFNVTAALLWYDPSGALVAVQTAELDPENTQWRTALIRATAPEGAKTLRLALLQRRSGGETFFGIPLMREI